MVLITAREMEALVEISVYRMLIPVVRETATTRVVLMDGLLDIFHNEMYGVVLKEIFRVILTETLNVFTRIQLYVEWIAHMMVFANYRRWKFAQI